jgi:hypothetical protein
MKYLAILTLVIVGCASPDTTKSILTDEKTSTIDSILIKSQKSIDSANSAISKSDQSITQKIEKTAEKIVKMEGEIKQLKAENNELKDKLDDATDAGKPYSGLPVSND